MRVQQSVFVQTHLYFSSQMQPEFLGEFQLNGKRQNVSYQFSRKLCCGEEDLTPKKNHFITFILKKQSCNLKNDSCSKPENEKNASFHLSADVLMPVCWVAAGI